MMQCFIRCLYFNENISETLTKNIYEFISEQMRLVKVELRKTKDELQQTKEELRKSNGTLCI